MPTLVIIIYPACICFFFFIYSSHTDKLATVIFIMHSSKELSQAPTPVCTLPNGAACSGLPPSTLNKICLMLWIYHHR